MFHAIAAAFWLFVVGRFLIPLSWSPGATVIVALALLLASQYHLLSRLFFGSMFSPEFPRGVVIIANTLFGTLLLLTALQALLDLIFLAVSLLQGAYHGPPLEARYLIGALALILPAYGLSQAVRVPPVKELEIAIPNLGPEFEGYRLIQLTDLHLSRLFQAPWAKKVVERTNAQKADLILVSGDLMDGTLEAREKDVEPLRGLNAPDGVIVIPGNHEYYFGYEGWMRKYQELGMTVLANQHLLLSRGASRLAIAGLTDSASSRFHLAPPDIHQALEGTPPDVPVILLDHQPKSALRNAQAGVALQLSGHTHGGMVVGLDRLVAKFNSGFVSGFYNVEGMQLYVNNGTALWNGFPFRIGVPSELTVITLRTKS